MASTFPACTATTLRNSSSRVHWESREPVTANIWQYSNEANSHDGRKSSRFDCRREGIGGGVGARRECSFSARCAAAVSTLEAPQNLLARRGVRRARGRLL